MSTKERIKTSKVFFIFTIMVMAFSMTSFAANSVTDAAKKEILLVEKIGISLNQYRSSSKSADEQVRVLQNKYRKFVDKSVTLSSPNEQDLRVNIGGKKANGGFATFFSADGRIFANIQAPTIKADHRDRKFLTQNSIEGVEVFSSLIRSITLPVVDKASVLLNFKNYHNLTPRNLIDFFNGIKLIVSQEYFQRMSNLSPEDEKILLASGLTPEKINQLKSIYDLLIGEITDKNFHPLPVERWKMFAGNDIKQGSLSIEDGPVQTNGVFSQFSSHFMDVFALAINVYYGILQKDKKPVGAIFSLEEVKEEIWDVDQKIQTYFANHFSLPKPEDNLYGRFRFSYLRAIKNCIPQMLENASRHPFVPRPALKLDMKMITNLVNKNELQLFSPYQFHFQHILHYDQLPTDLIRAEYLKTQEKNKDYNLFIDFNNPRERFANTRTFLASIHDVMTRGMVKVIEGSVGSTPYYWLTIFPGTAEYLVKKLSLDTNINPHFAKYLFNYSIAELLEFYPEMIKDFLQFIHMKKEWVDSPAVFKQTNKDLFNELASIFNNDPLKLEQEIRKFYLNWKRGKNIEAPELKRISGNYYQNIFLYHLYDFNQGNAFVKNDETKTLRMRPRPEMLQEVVEHYQRVALDDVRTILKESNVASKYKVIIEDVFSKIITEYAYDGSVSAEIGKKLDQFMSELRADAYRKKHKQNHLEQILKILFLNHSPQQKVLDETGKIVLGRISDFYNICLKMRYDVNDDRFKLLTRMIIDLYKKHAETVVYEKRSQFFYKNSGIEIHQNQSVGFRGMGSFYNDLKSTRAFVDTIYAKWELPPDFSWPAADPQISNEVYPRVGHPVIYTNHGATDVSAVKSATGRLRIAYNYAIKAFWGGSKKPALITILRPKVTAFSPDFLMNGEREDRENFEDERLYLNVTYDDAIATVIFLPPQEGEKHLPYGDIKISDVVWHNYSGPIYGLTKESKELLDAAIAFSNDKNNHVHTTHTFRVASDDEFKRECENDTRRSYFDSSIECKMAWVEYLKGHTSSLERVIGMTPDEYDQALREEQTQLNEKDIFHIVGRKGSLQLLPLITND